MTTWRQAVWEAVQRQGARGHVITLEALKKHELAQIMAETGRSGRTPDATMRRVLQELRKAGVLYFEARGNYTIAQDSVGAQRIDEAIETQVAREVMVRTKQGKFRNGLFDRWQGRCPLSEITEPVLLRASHIIPWCECSSGAERVTPENGLLLSVSWDAAFDKGLVSFADNGNALLCPNIEAPARRMLESAPNHAIHGLTPGNRERLAWHRTRWGFA